MAYAITDIINLFHRLLNFAIDGIGLWISFL